MSIKGRSLWTLKNAVRLAEASGEFRVRDITPAGINPPVAVREDEIVVETQGQTAFTLTVDALPGAINSLVFEGKTYFEPDFTLSGRTLTLGVLLQSRVNLNSVLRFESIGGGLAAGHFRLEILTVRSNGQGQLVLDGTPQGDVTEVFHLGLCYPQSEGHFTVSQNVITWLNTQSPLHLANYAYVLYARTAEAAAIQDQQTFAISATTDRTLMLDSEPAFAPRMYRRGLRHFEGTDFTRDEYLIEVDADVPFVTGDRLSFMVTTSPVIVPDTPPTEEPPPPTAPVSYFEQRQTTATANQTDFTGLMAGLQPSKSLLSINGLTMAQNMGYAVTAGVVTVQSSPPLKQGDIVQLLGFKSPSASAAFSFVEVTPADPLDLGMDTVAPTKVFAILASQDAYGGLIYGPSTLVHETGNRIFGWEGAPALKPTDRLVIGFMTDATVAAAVTLVETTVGAGGLSWTLGKQPTEIAFATLNGLQLTEGELTFANKVASYSGATPLQQGDKLMVLFY